jgi:hypothetical protein
VSAPWRPMMLVALLGCAVWPCAPRAQDFASPLPAGPGNSPLALLEDGLADTAALALAGAAATRWLGIADLETHAVAAGLGLRSLRAAAGISRTGPPDLGWASAGIACGATVGTGGAALRGVVRRERGTAVPVGPLGAGVGAEAGGGAWLEAAPGLVLWVRAPQMWTRGLSPPLARGLALGGRWSDAGAAVWFERTAPARSDDEAGRHLLGASLDVGSALLWIEARDGPLRGGLGLGVRLGTLGLGARVDAHPVLGDTALLALTLGPRRSRP